jgi:myo-inositol-1(or 4)-monophosphatase
MGRLVALEEAWRKVRMLGSAALSLAWLAAGRLDGYQECGIMWWDVAAGLALVKSASGTINVEGARPDAPVDVHAAIAAAGHG